MHMQADHSGCDLVLLHGWGMNAGAWAAVQAPLAQRYPLHAVDLPGFAGGAFAAQEMDVLLQDLLHRLPARFSLLGWSWGGQLALRMWQLAPGRIERLVLVATPPRFVQSADWPHAVAPAVFEQFAAGLAQDGGATLRRFFALQAQGLPDARQVARHLRGLVETHGAPDAAALQWGLTDLLRRDMRQAAQQCQAPVLLIQGTADALVPVAAGQWLQSIMPAARMLLLQQCGHAPFVSHPGAFVKAVTEFLDE